MGGSGALIAVLALAIAAAGPASAETWKGLDLERKLRETPWHIGPFRIQPQLVISNAGIDSNVFYSPSEPVKDFTVTAGPAATIYLPITGAPSAPRVAQYVWFRRRSRNDLELSRWGGLAQLKNRNTEIEHPAAAAEEGMEVGAVRLVTRPPRPATGRANSRERRMGMLTSGNG
jgi:hypothetical protein